MKGIFISGTNTGVGKTIVSAALMTRASQIYKSISYHKPIQTGMLTDNDAQTVAGLLSGPAAISVGLSFKRPLSPHRAAHYESHLIHMNSVVTKAKLLSRGDFNVIEGAGGLLVPINNRAFMIDLIKQLHLPCALVASTSLGTINHTLLSIEALRLRGIPLLGVIMNGPKNRDNEDSIRFYGKVDKVITLPWLRVVNRDSLSAMVAAYSAHLDGFLE